MKNSKISPSNLEIWYHLIKAKVSRLSMSGDYRFGGADFVDPTTNVRRRRALAIAKPTSEGYWPRRSMINLTRRVYFLRANEEEARNWECNLDIANIRWKLYWSRWGSVTPWSGRWTQTKYAKLQLWQTFNLNKTQSLNVTLRVVYMEEEGGISWPLGKGSETDPISCFPTHMDSKNSLYSSILKIQGPGRIIRWRNT